MKKNKINDNVSWGQSCKIEDIDFLLQNPIRKIKDLKTVIGDGAICLRGGILYLGSRIGDNLFLGHNSIIREENQIGNNFKIWNNSVIDYGCKIGNNVKVHCNCYVAQFTLIEDDVFLAPGVIIANDKYPGSITSKDDLSGPRIKRGAQIGANVTILPGVTIGEDAIIGAGSVVTKNVASGKIVCGNPARVIKNIRDLKGYIKKNIF